MIVSGLLCAVLFINTEAFFINSLDDQIDYVIRQVPITKGVFPDTPINFVKETAKIPMVFGDFNILRYKYLIPFNNLLPIHTVNKIQSKPFSSTLGKTQN